MEEYVLLFFLKGGKPSGKEVKERRSKLETALKMGFVKKKSEKLNRAMC